jgi:hypothetical protein
LNILDFSNMHWCNPTIWHASPSSKAWYSWLTCHSSIAKDLSSASSYSYHVLGSFMKNKWIWCLYGTTIACMLDMI